MGHGSTPKTPTPFPYTKTPEAFSPFPDPPHPSGSALPCLCSSSIGSLEAGHPRERLARGPPWGAALPGPGPGFSSSPWSGAGAATAGNASGGRGLLRLGPPGRGETGMGGEGGRDRKALPLPGEFAGWGPSGTAGGPSLGTGASGITAGMSRGGVRCPLSPRESHAEATKSSQPSLPVSLSYHGVLSMGGEEGECHNSLCQNLLSLGVGAEKYRSHGFMS